MGGGGDLVAKSGPTLVTPWTVACQALCPWDSPGKSTGVGCHFLLHGIFPTQGSNLGLLHCGQTVYHLSHQGSLVGEGDQAQIQTNQDKWRFIVNEQGGEQ